MSRSEMQQFGVSIGQDYPAPIPAAQLVRPHGGNIATVLSWAVLAVLCCAVLCCAVLCCAGLGCAVLFLTAVLGCAALFSQLCWKEEEELYKLRPARCCADQHSRISTEIVQSSAVECGSCGDSTTPVMISCCQESVMGFSEITWRMYERQDTACFNSVLDAASAVMLVT